ncbi:MAG: 4,5-DOPA dioxygenase extradiol [Oscillospiraceae bacterium]|nr:4,5-DOPA dioxygenase extradiol [Oscillospiraceae bacterium]
MKRMPVIFSGHGDPMIALRDDAITRGMAKIGQSVLAQYGKPKAILAVSAHWYVPGTFVQKTETPKQIYDMYGFPQALYEVQYPAKGDAALSGRVLELLSGEVTVNNNWGIDHGIWTVLVHMFPEADIPVVQLSVDRRLSPARCYALGQKLAALREEGYLIFGSGNVVHNLRLVEWNNPGGTAQTVRFNDHIIDRIRARDDAAVIGYADAPDAAYAVPTPDHFLPLLYILGAAEGEQPLVFNNVCNLGSMAMTGFAFGLE